MIILIGMGLDIVAFAIHKLTGLKMNSMPLTMFCFQMWYMGAFFRYLMIGWVDNAGLTPELQGTFADLVGKFRLAGMSLKTSSGKNVNAVISRKVVYVPKASLDHLSKEALDWLIGHELTHQKFFDLRGADPGAPTKWKVRIALAFLCMLGISLRFEITWITAAIDFVLLVFIFIFIVQASKIGRDFIRDTELACDYVSMIQLGSSKGAIEALEAMKHVTKKSNPYNYPTKEDRIQQAQDFAEGKPRTPYDNIKVEAAVTAILAELK